MADHHEEQPSPIVGLGRGSVLLKRCNDLRDAMRITHEEVQAAIERKRREAKAARERRSREEG